MFLNMLILVVVFHTGPFPVSRFDQDLLNCIRNMGNIGEKLVSPSFRNEIPEFRHQILAFVPGLDQDALGLMARRWV